MAKLQCVRCKVKRGDVERAHMFFCETCRDQHQTVAFAGTAPVYQLKVVDGRCEFCDEVKPLHYCQWLLCGICANVVGSYRKGKVSARFVLAQLEKHVVPFVTGLTFKEVDPVVVKPHTQRGRQARATQLDLEGLRDGKRVMWVEVKTGPASIGAGGMAEFQLDCQDCDDILNTTITSGLPVILAHCQISKSVQPPTMRIVGENVWWTDLTDFGAAFKEVFERRGEARKLAASFRPECFKELPALVEILKAGWVEEATAKLAESPPSLYRLSDVQLAAAREKAAAKTAKKEAREAAKREKIAAKAAAKAEKAAAKAAKKTTS